ncbi:MAG TPA: hypothetical protein DD670_10795 [Planctomycetaceae bacterium]|nr:hypothetical protein [Planctomycetaceae bacterium]
MKRTRIGSISILFTSVLMLGWPGWLRAEPRGDSGVAPGGPFGVQLGIPAERLPANLDEAVRIGASWVRLTGTTGANWARIEPSPGRYEWAELDRAVAAPAQRGMKVLVTIESGNPIYRSRQGYLPGDLRAHARFLTRLVERYDGDGTEDAPGSPVVDAWQIENEVDIRSYWPDSMANYATLLRQSYKTIKLADPGAKVAMAGMMDPTGLRKYAEIMRHLDGGPDFDVFDLHWNCRGGGDYKLQIARNMGHIPFDTYLREARRLLDSPAHRNAEIWITETSRSDSANPFDNERAQADDLVRRFVYPFCQGVPVVFWYHVHDYPWDNKPADYFSRAGLVHEKGEKKLAYFTYALLTEKLAGCDPRDVEIVEETNTVRAYRFARQGSRQTTPLWVLWTDGLAAADYALDVGLTRRVRVTEAVPRVGIHRGAAIKRPAEAFATSVLPSRAGRVELRLSPGIPLYVEWVE